ncbi:MAG: LPS export ABC transporter permease LptG [Wenzhouxiangellaceae bacterium]
MSRLTRYLVTRLAVGYVVIFAAVGGLVWVIALLDQLGDSAAGSSFLDAALHAMLRVPTDLIDLLPVVALLATAMVLSAMQTAREIVVMRASGVSLWRITGQALLPGVALAFAALLALQFLAPVIYRTGSSVQKEVDSSLWHPWHGLWIRSETELMNVGRFEPGQLPGQIMIWEFDTSQQLNRVIRAERAIPARGLWSLEQVTIKTFDDDPDRIQHHRQWLWPSFLTDQQLLLFRSTPRSLSLLDLWRYVQSMKERQLDAAEFELVLWRRAALPLACLGMVLVAVALAARPARRGGTSLKVTLAVGIGLAYHLLSGMAGFVGLVADLPVFATAWLPPFVLVAIALWLLKTSR